MSQILYLLEPFEPLDFPVFKAYADATSEIPTGLERLKCSREALYGYDQKLIAINLEYREAVLDACGAIVERFAERNVDSTDS